MGATTKTLYEKDFVEWSARTAELIANARAEMLDDLEDSPSLRRFLDEVLEKRYQQAVQQALIETGLEAKAAELKLPPRCPYTVAELLEDPIEKLVAKLN